MAVRFTSRAEARAAGAKKYFTGKPCARQHFSERYVSTTVCHQCNTERMKERQTNNPETLRAYRKKWSDKNPEKMASAVRSWHKRNAARRLEQCKKWQAANPEKMRVVWRRRSARKRNAEGSHTAGDITQIEKAQRGKCGYCRVKLDPKTRHVDHIEPLARGGSNGRHNLQLLCQPCNQAKYAKDPLDFAREIGRLC